MALETCPRQGCSAREQLAEASQVMIACSCDPSFSFRTPESWRKDHYEMLRPAGARERQQFARAHVPVLNIETFGHGVPIGTKVETDDSRILQEIRSLNGRIEADRLDIQLCEAHIAQLLRDLKPLPIPQKKWWRDSVAIACHTCGRETKHRFGGLPTCAKEVHREKEATTKGISDELWGLILE